MNKQLPQRFQRFEQHLPHLDDPLLVVLKGHLLAEEILDEIIRARCTDVDALKGIDLTFFVKSRLARALTGKVPESDIDIPYDLWPMLDAFNELRNDFAHYLESRKLVLRMKKFINMTSATYSELDDDKQVLNQLSNAVGYLLGFLTCVEEIVRSGRVPPKLR